MQERDSGRRTTSESRSTKAGKDRYRDDEEGGARSMTTRPQQEGDEWSGQGSEGGWSGYVVPYRYYGPGYRGVGYYSVMYQGGGAEGAEDSESRYGQLDSGYRQNTGWDTRAAAFGGDRTARG